MKAPYAQVPLSKPQYLAFVGWPLLPPTSELHILEGKKPLQTSGGFFVWAHSSIVLLPAPCILFPTEFV